MAARTRQKTAGVNTLSSDVDKQKELPVKAKNTRKANNPEGNSIMDSRSEMFENEDEKKAFTRKALTQSLKYWSKPIVKDDEEAIDRINEYFTDCAENGMNPTVEGLALALGCAVTTLWDWETGRIRKISPEIVKKAKSTIASFSASMVEAGKLNPIAYIFRAKNYYGMKDQQEYVLTPNNPTEEYSEAKLLEAAKALPGLPESSIK